MKTITKRNIIVTILFALIICLFGSFGLMNTTFAMAEELSEVELKTIEEVSPSMVKGASVRVANKFGLRYSIYMDQSEYEGLIANVGDGKAYKNVTFGVLVAPEFYEDTYGILNEDNLFGDAAQYDWADINGNYTGTNGQNGGKVRIINAEGTKMQVPSNVEELPEELQEQDIVIYNGSVVDFKSTANTLLNYRGVGYICAVNQDDTLSYKLATANDNLRSMVYVAQKAVEAGGANADTIASTYITEQVKNTDVDYTVEYYMEDVTGAFVKSEEHSSSVTGKIASTATILPIENLIGYIHLDNELDVTSSTVYANGSTTLKYYYKKLYSKEFDLNGEKTLDVSSELESLDIASGTLQTVSILNDDGTKTPYTYEEGTPTTLTNVIGKEKVTLIFEGTNKSSVVDAKIYSLKITTLAQLKDIGKTFETYKVENVDEDGNIVSYSSDGYYVLMNDITATSKGAINRGFYIKMNGDENDGFKGVFDGQGYKISGINTYSISASGAPTGTASGTIFGSLAKGGVIKNVSIAAGNIGTADTRAIFGKYCYGTLENVRVHIEKTGFAATEEAPLFNYAFKSGSTIKNVVVSFGSGVVFTKTVGGLVSTFIDTKGVNISGLYVIGPYTCAGAMRTWSTSETSDTSFIEAMTKDDVKYGAYFASTSDFTSGIETVGGVTQTATNVYKNQIADLFDESVWDLTGDLPEFITKTN